MKSLRDYFTKFAAILLCAGALAVGNVFCMVTAFNIPVDAELTAIICVFAAVMFSLAFSVKKPWPWVTVLCIIWGIIIWLSREALHSELFIAVRAVQEAFSQAYGFIPPPETATFGTATLFLSMLGVVLAFLTAWALRERWVFIPLAAVSIAMLVLCLTIIDTVPKSWTCMLLFGAYALLILSQSPLRHNSYGTVLKLALPVAALIAIAAVIVRPSSYVQPAWTEEFREYTKTHAIIQYDRAGDGVRIISPIASETLGGLNNDVSEFRLDNLGTQTKTGKHVMDIYSDQSSRYYLKGYSLSEYSDNTWRALDDDCYDDVVIPSGFWAVHEFSGSVLKIRTDKRASIFYLPYIPAELPEGAETYYDAYAANPEYVTEYSVPYFEGEQYLGYNRNYEAFVNEYYTQVPPETKAALEPIVSVIKRSSSYQDADCLANNTAEYVKTSAEYSLNTPSVPDGKDFVCWFLNDSDTGYCVHFASATAVLLRCMGIPARYTVGFMAETTAGEWTAVTEDDAHAWVEYYVNGIGWRMLESTPGSTDTTENDDNIIEPPENDTTEPEPPDVPDTNIPEVTDKDTSTVSETEQTEQTKSPVKKHIPAFVWIIPGLIAMVFALRMLLGYVRKRALGRNQPNKRAIAFYHHIKFISRLAKCPVSDEVTELALKARFSQHTISDDELTVLKTASDTLGASLPAFWRRVLAI